MSTMLVDPTPDSRSAVESKVDRLNTASLERRMIPFIIGSPAFLAVMILAGEEIPDLLQKLVSEPPDTDRVLAEVDKYHRMEEARHLAFARTTLPELYAEAGLFTKLRIEYAAPWSTPTPSR